jgi:hypothetical protein
MSYGFLRIVQQREDRFDNANRGLGVAAIERTMARARRKMRAIKFVGSINQVQSHAANLPSHQHRRTPFRILNESENILGMKFLRPLLLSVLLVVMPAASAVAQSPAASTSNSSPDSIKSETHTVTGRIVKLDTKSRIFSVRTGASGKVIDLQADKSVDINSLRRGERVVVTYAADVALKVQATRSEK